MEFRKKLSNFTVERAIIRSLTISKYNCQKCSKNSHKVKSQNTKQITKIAMTHQNFLPLFNDFCGNRVHEVTMRFKLPSIRGQVVKQIWVKPWLPEVFK